MDGRGLIQLRSDMRGQRLSVAVGGLGLPAPSGLPWLSTEVEAPCLRLNRTRTGPTVGEDTPGRIWEDQGVQGGEGVLRRQMP